MVRCRLDLTTHSLRLAKPFRISGYVFETWDVVRVTLTEGAYRGRGEGGGAYFLGDDVARMTADIEVARALIEAGLTREVLRTAMPPGGGRNAVDCALWELEAARSGRPVWQVAGTTPPAAVRTTFTIGADAPATMAENATAYRQAKSIKMKLTGEPALDLLRVEAVRRARPDVWLGVDGNQGYSVAELPALIHGLSRFDVSLLEQPLARGCEADLEGLASPIPIAGDESLLTSADIAGAVGRFDVVNIKLDKCGGLTEGLAMAVEARRHGLGVMVGCMVGTSIAMAPAFLLGQVCDLVDLDGPTFLAEDVSPGVVYRDGTISAGDDVWGSAAALVA